MELAKQHQQDSNWINNLDAEVPSVYQAARTLMNEEGIRGFFAGTGVRMAKMVPTMAVYLSSFNVLKSTLTVKLFTPLAAPVMFAQVAEKPATYPRLGKEESEWQVSTKTMMDDE